MKLHIDNETRLQELERLLSDLFALPEVGSVKIRDIEIISPKETEKLRQAVEAGYHDILSDIDVGVYVTLHPADIGSGRPYHSNPERLGFCRNRYLGLSCSGEGDFQMCRLILKSGIRFDVGFYITSCEMAPRLSIPIKEEKEQKKAGRFWPYWDLRKADSFWFMEIQALAKLYRRDYLIADHLANMAVNETLVAQMVMRDDAYGTNFHRYGHGEKPAYPLAGKADSGLWDGREKCFADIGGKLYAAAVTYDKLVKELNPFYEECRQIFFEIWKQYDEGMRTAEGLEEAHETT